MRSMNPCFTLLYFTTFRQTVSEAVNRSEVGTLHVARVWSEVDAGAQYFAFARAALRPQ